MKARISNIVILLLFILGLCDGTFSVYVGDTVVIAEDEVTEAWTANYEGSSLC